MSKLLQCDKEKGGEKSARESTKVTRKGATASGQGDHLKSWRKREREREDGLRVEEKVRVGEREWEESMI